MSIADLEHTLTLAVRGFATMPEAITVSPDIVGEAHKTLYGALSRAPMPAMFSTIPSIAVDRGLAPGTWHKGPPRVRPEPIVYFTGREGEAYLMRGVYEMTLRCPECGYRNGVQWRPRDNEPECLSRHTRRRHARGGTRGRRTARRIPAWRPPLDIAGRAQAQARAEYDHHRCEVRT